MNEREYMMYQFDKMVKELGRIPTHIEYLERIGTHNYIKKNFKTYNNLVREMGYTPNHNNRYDTNPDAFIDYLVNYYKEHGTFPTTEYIREHTNLSFKIMRDMGTYENVKEYVLREVLSEGE